MTATGSPPAASAVSSSEGGQGGGGGDVRARLRAPILFLTVLVLATSGLVYELLAGTLASYVLGDSVTQFSTTIGTYLFAMGVGSWLSRFIRGEVSQRFLEIELAAAVAGGTSAPVLFLAFAYGAVFPIVLYGVILIVGVLVGLEIPLLMRILREELAFEELVARVLTFDYLGALVGSLLFALVLVPELGLTQTSLLFGMLNATVALGGTWVLAEVLRPAVRRRLRVGGVLVLALLGAGLVQAEALTVFGEQAMYADPIVHAARTPYQRIVVTQGRGSVQLFLNGNLQFSSRDEHRYHESLVHPAFAAAPRHRRVLILGGGDGLALREVFRYPGVEEVTLVDLDPGVTELARRLPSLRTLNQGALDDPRLTLVNADAMVWLDQRRASAREEAPAPYDVAIVDFPDPGTYSLGKLYTRRFYRMLRGALTGPGVVAVQATSPLVARRSYWCVVRTLAAAGLTTAPYHASVPSFGEWGFVLASPDPTLSPPTHLLEVDGLRFLNDAVLPGLFRFPRDMGPVPAEPNRLNEQVLVRYYEADWRAAR